MDKLKIKYNGAIENSYAYELRIPEDLNWFVISRYSNEKNGDFDADYLIYNGNIIFKGYSYKENRKIQKYYNKNQEEKIQKEIAYDLLQNIGVNLFTLQILDRLKFDVNHIKRKCWRNYWFNRNINYFLKGNLVSDENYKELYDIVFNNDILGKIFMDNGNLEIEIKPHNQVDIIQLFKSKVYRPKNNKFSIAKNH